MKIGILAGEASGDLLGANLITALRHFIPELSVYGIGGPAMQQVGCKSLYNMERLSVMGLVEPLFRLPELFKIRNGILQHFLNNRPDIFIGIDSPDFNLGLEQKLKHAGIPVIHYVSPTVWAWRPKRIHKIAKATDLVLTLFPFESNFYHQYNVPSKFIGHPLADVIPLHTDKMAARQKLNLAADATYIAILPGSRHNEIKYLAKIFVETARRCWQMNPALKFISSAINEERMREFQQICSEMAPELPMQIFLRDSHDVLAASDVVLVTSGTAALEAMLFKRPMVIAYRMAGVTFQLAKWLVKVPYIGLPNLLANERVVPELIQKNATPDKLASELMNYLQHPEEVTALEKKFCMLHEELRCDASLQAAEAVLALHHAHTSGRPE